MKLVISAADFGMTEGITDGCIRAIRDGILMDVGLMTNNYKYAERAVKEWKKYPHVSIGWDINLVSGIPATAPELIPSLVDENGLFVKSSVRINKNNAGLDGKIAYVDAYLELENQLKRYIELVGKKPTYVMGHSYRDENSEKAVIDLCRKYDIPYGFEKVLDLHRPKKGWYIPPEGAKGNKKEAFASADWQKQIDVVQKIITDECGLLDNEYGLLRMHIGYPDKELYDMSTVHDIRAIETSALCDPKVKEHFKKHQVEIINFSDFFNEKPFSWEEIE